MKMYLSGDWVAAENEIEVVNPFDGSIVDTVPHGSVKHVEQAIEGLTSGASSMRELPIWRRAEILINASNLLKEQEQRFAELITREEGKAIRESRAEVRRSATTLQLSGEEARRQTG